MSVTDALKLKEAKTVNIDIDTKLPLYDYQKVGAVFMYVVKKCMILDDPGLGKTAQGIGYLKLLQKHESKNLKALVVTTSSTIYQWKDEVERFSNLYPMLIDGGKSRRQKTYESFGKGRANVLIINYSKINYDFEYLNQLTFDTIIFDEGQALKDSTTKTYSLFNIIAGHSQRIVIMTATPISNNLEEFYNLFQLFHTKYLPEYPEFREHFLETKPVVVQKGQRKFTIQTVIGSKNISEFRQLIDPFFIRRENENEGDFTNFKLEIKKIPILMTREQKDTLSQLKFEHLSSEDSVILRVFSDFTKVSCCPCIYSPDKSNISPKAIELIRLIKNLNRKVVVFAKFIEYHQILQDYLTNAGITYVSITGLQTPKEKEDNKQKFREDPDVQVILLTGAGKLGLNLQTSNIIIFVDMPYTPSDVFQYIGRVYRTGQKSDVTAYFLYHENSLEEDLFASLYRKQKEIDEFFSQDKAPIFELHFDSDVNVKQSFMSRTYRKGPAYDDLPQDLNLYVPEKKVQEKQKLPTVEESSGFYSVDMFDL